MVRVPMKGALAFAAGSFLLLLGAAWQARPCGDLCETAFWAAKPTADQIADKVSLLVNVNGVSLTAGRPSPLHLAIQHRSTAGVDVLLAAGADPNRATKGGDTPLGYAARFGDVQVLRLLLAAGADPNQPTGNTLWEAPLHTAASQGSPGMLAALIAAGAEIEGLDRGEATPLGRAARGQKLQNVRFLLAAGADVEGACALQGPLAEAAWRGPFESVTALLEAGANPAGCTGKTAPILRAGSSKDPRIVKTLLDAGAAADARDVHGGNALHTAARFGDFESLVLLLEAGARVDARGHNGQTPLHAGAAGYMSDRSQHIAALLRAGADADAIDDKGLAPIHLAIGAGLTIRPRELKEESIRTRSLQALIAGGANVELREPDGATPYLLAARFGGPEMMSALVDAGADPDALGRLDRRVIHYAATAAHPANLVLLISQGVNLETRDREGNTALHFATAERSPANADILIEAGAPLNALDNHNQSPLHIAARLGASDTVLFLLDAGANPDVRNARGLTALDLAYGNRQLRGTAGYKALAERTAT